MSALKSVLGISTSSGIRLTTGSYTGTDSSHDYQYKTINIGGTALYIIFINLSNPDSSGPCIIFRFYDNSSYCVEIGNSAMYISATFNGNSVEMRGRTINYTNIEYSWTAAVY